MQTLTKASARRRKKAFEVLYGRYAQKMQNYFFYMLNRDRAKAQDFLQDLFLKLIEKPEKFDTRRSFSSWLFSVAANLCKNEYRRLQVRSGFHAGHEPELSRQPGFRETRQTIRLALEVLSHDHKSAFVLRHKFSCSIAEIARILDCSEGTVKSRLFYATKKMAHFLEKQGVQPN